MGRPERPIDPAGGPVQRFALLLRELRGQAGRPSYRQMARQAHFSVTALSEAAGGEVFPSLSVAMAYVQACGGDLADWEQRWQAAAREIAAAAAHEDEPTGPYLGLATFEAVDAPRFFGRDRLTAELLDRVDRRAFVAVFGASGSGKSSLLRAGLMPAVAGKDGERWLTTLLTPGARPFRQLVLRLMAIADTGPESAPATSPGDPDDVAAVVGRIVADGSTRLLIVVDQFEEIFTLCHDEDERVRSIAALLAAAEIPGARVVLGVRADFYAPCAAYPALVTALRDSQFLIGAMTAEELRRVVVGPAEKAGLRVEPALVELILGDTGTEPGALPLLSHALLETWRRRRGAVLTTADYLATGGVKGAIARTAEDTYGTFEPTEREVTREVFLRLTAFGDGTEDTRRRVTAAELLAGPNSTAVTAVLSRLTAARLIVSDADLVTVAHEALIRGWPRLRGWLAEDRDLLRAGRRLTETATEWNEHGREDGFLYRGTRLAMWEGRPRERLNDLERAFLDASFQRAARDAAARRRKTRSALMAFSVVTTVVSVLTVVALVQANRATAERDVALSGQLTAEAQRVAGLDPEQALSLARRAYATAATREAETTLRQMTAGHNVLSVVPGGSKRVLGVAFSPDGRRLVGTGDDGVVRVWNWTSQRVDGGPAELRGHVGEVWSPVFSPDGGRLATAGVDGTVRVWDLSPGVQPGGGTVLRGHEGPVWSVAFSPDGRRLASTGDDGRVRLWKVGGAGPPVELGRHRGTATAVAFSPDGRLVASGGHDRAVRLWRVSGGAAAPAPLSLPEMPKRLIFSGDGAWLLCAVVDGTARALRVDGAGEPLVWRGHSGRMEGLALSGDGWWIATGSDDHTVRVWSRNGRGEPLILRGHKSTVWALTFSPDGSRLASAGDDGTVRIWDPRGAGEPLLLRGHRGPTYAAVFHPDGRRVISAGADGTVRVWGSGSAPPAVLRGHRSEVYGLSVSADGRRVASASSDGTIRVWELGGSGPPVVLSGHRGVVWTAAFSPDGRRLVSAGADGTMRIWSSAGDAAPLVRRVDSNVRYAAFDPAGDHVATAGKDGNVRIWDTSGTTQPAILRGHEGLVYVVAYSPDGKRLASAGTDGTVRIWSTANHGPALVLRGHQGFAWFVTFSPDGTWIASTGQDGTVRLWRTDRAGQPVTFQGFRASTESIAFSPDGQRLVTTHDDGTVRVWRCGTCGPIAHIGP